MWTSLEPESSVKGNPYTSLMTLDIADAPQQDTFVFLAPTVAPAKATVHVDWMPGIQGLYPYSDPVPNYPVRSADGGFAGEYILAGAHMDFSFTSQVSATDKTQSSSRYVWSRLPESASHSAAVLSNDPVSTRRPSVAIVTEETQSSCA